MSELLAVKANEWERELEGHAKFFKSLCGVVPEELEAQRDKLAKRLARN